jgi:hypothetical protein
MAYPSVTRKGEIVVGDAASNVREVSLGNGCGAF